MYSALLVLLLLPAGWLLYVGFDRSRRGFIAAGATIAAATLGLFSLLDFWGEMLWFEALGYRARFWTVIGAQVVATAAGAILGWLGVFLLTRPLPRAQRPVLVAAQTGGALIGALAGAGAWDKALLFLHAAPSGLREPLVGLDASFYLFALPLFDQLLSLATWIVLVALAAVLATAFKLGDDRSPRLRSSFAPQPLYIVAAAFAAVLAAHQVMAVFHLLYSGYGVVTGPGWTDTHVRLPAHWVVAALTLAVGAALLWPPLRRRMTLRSLPQPAFSPLIVGAGAIAAAWISGLGLLPAAFQWLLVEPNEVTYEAPYIRNNIRFTRHGFRLHEIEERRFPAEQRLTRAQLRDSRPVLDNVRLWDWRALNAVYGQFQEIRLYYEFHDVDIDRYDIDGVRRQVMISAREMEQDNLPPDSRTFVNRRFKYTHGYGLTMAPVSEFTPDGLPNLLIKDIPPVVAAPELQVERPQVYYGERTRQPVVVNTTEAEFDYPSGETNVEIRYPGTGGVQLSNLWRRFVYGWMFDGTRLLVSTYPTAESRIMFHRQVHERARTVAPFLVYDKDPYIVLADGRLHWILDAYTVSSYFPYSTPLAPAMARTRFGTGPRHLYGANYVRNSVKVVIDAFEGSVDFYAFEPEDPLLQTWQRVFPGLIKPREQMPATLQAHVRYPADFLLAQGLVYSRYHMTDPEVFYNQEDLWVQATEKHYGGVETVDPYYVMWQLPDSTRPEFSLILPFTPKNRQVLIGWIAGLSDGANYGRFLAYKFPKEKRVLGPQQVETKIDQDRFLSAQLSLWDQRGSNVIRGNVLAIPLDDTLLYVEPIYLEAETAAYPELRLVVVMHGDRMSYAETFDAALDGLFAAADAPAAKPFELGVAPQQSLAERANEAFEAYLRLQAEQRFDAAAAQLQTLRDALRELAKADDVGSDGDPLVALPQGEPDQD